MFSVDNTVFEAARPIQLLTKIFGLCSQKGVDIFLLLKFLKNRSKV